MIYNIFFCHDPVINRFIEINHNKSGQQTFPTGRQALQ